MITLSGGVPTWFYDQFSDTLYHVCQRKPSLLQQAVIVEDITAEDKAFDMMGMFSLVDKTARSPATPTLDPTTQRRWLKPAPAHNSVLYDRDDDLAMLINPVGDFTNAFRYAVNRKKDSVIFTALNATVQAGRKYGDSTVAWTDAAYARGGTGRVIAHDTSVGNAQGASTGLTKEKIELAVEYFRVNDVDPDIPLFGVVNPVQVTDMYGQEEFISADYNSDKPLVQGRLLGNWMGVNWISYTGVKLGSNNDVDADTNVYPVWVWAQDGMKLGVADALTIKMSEESTLSYSQRVYVHINVGAVRMDEDKVCKIECV